MNAISPFRQPASPTPYQPQQGTTPAKSKLDELIQLGRRSCEKLIRSIFEHNPVDFLVKGSALTFTLKEKIGPAMLLKAEKGEPALVPVHSHALGQLSDKLEIPRAYVDRLNRSDLHHQALLVHNFNQLAANMNSRLLVRVSNGEVRGVVSDRYRRLDSKPIVEAFIRAIKAAGAVPYSGTATDISYSIKAVLPIVHEPIRGEALAFGLELANSDFGARALSVSLFVLRIRCANLAVFSEDMRKVHLGARLGDDAHYSDRTHYLDSATVCSAIGDIISRNLLPERLETIIDLIRRSAQEHVSPDQLTPWLKKNLSKAEAAAVTNAFNSPDIEMLPPGQNRYRFSQAISWVAGKQEDGERKLDLERLAGEFLTDAA